LLDRLREHRNSADAPQSIDHIAAAGQIQSDRS
jgi:hypothetical protein